MEAQATHNVIFAEELSPLARSIYDAVWNCEDEVVLAESKENPCFDSAWRELHARGLVNISTFSVAKYFSADFSFALPCEV